MLEQQLHRQTKIQENLSSGKKITYLITFPNGELANDAKIFLEKQGFNKLVVVHHDKVHSKTWEAEYSIKRIDEWIAEKEKNKNYKN